MVARVPLLPLIPVVSALVVVAVRGGDWRSVLSLRLRQLWLVWAAVGIHVVRQTDPAWAAFALRPLRGLWPVLIIWLLAAAFVGTNLRVLPAPARPGLVVLALGFTLNTLATAANGGMPFSTSAARLAGLSDDAIGRPLLGHPPLTPDSRLAPLADIIPLPGLERVLSIGDIAMLAGFGWLLAAFMLAVPHRRAGLPEPSAGAHPPVKGGDVHEQVHR